MGSALTRSAPMSSEEESEPPDPPPLQERANPVGASLLTHSYIRAGAGIRLR